MKDVSKVLLLRNLRILLQINFRGMGIVKIDIIRADFTRLNKIQSQNSVKQASWTLFENRFLKISNQSVHN